MRKKDLLVAQITCCVLFGPILVAATFHVMYFTSYNLYVVFSIHKTRKNKKKDLLVAQTTCNMLFGPVLITTTFHVVYYTSCNLYVVVNIHKTRKNEKKWEKMTY